MRFYVQTLQGMDDAQLVAHAISVYVDARKSDGHDLWAQVDDCGQECWRRQGRDSALWQQILDGVVREEAAIRAGNEAKRTAKQETTP